jgi:glycosyltransferase involved in cell wall biosynthesis
MASADLAIVPKRASTTFGDEAASTKILEFMSVGVPVLVARTSIDTLLFGEGVVRFFESDDVQSLANELLYLYRNKDIRDELSNRGLVHSRENAWTDKRRVYLNIIDSLA